MVFSLNRSLFYRRLALFCATYTIVAILGLKFTAIYRFAALIWPPTGLAFAVLMVWGRRYWPGVFIGAFVSNVYVGASIPVATGIALGNTLEAVVAVAWCSRGFDFHAALERFQDVSRLIIRAATFSTLISASLGVLSLWLSGALLPEQVTASWLQWWAGDSLSNLTFGPLMLIALNFRRADFFEKPIRALEALVFAIVMSLFSLMVLSGFFLSHFTLLTGLKGIYMLIPLLLWGALRFGQKGAVFAVFVISEIAIGSTVLQIGPFSHDSSGISVMHLLIFVVVVALTGLLVGAVVTERENERQDLKLSKLELQQREAELQQSKAAADAANAAKSTFLANMSHEIRTPLGAVMGFSELLADPSILDSDRRMAIDAIQRNGRLLSNIIDDVLDLSRVEAGKLPIEKTTVGLTDLLSDLRALLEPRALEKGIELKISVHGSVPEKIKTDPLRLQQILLNVVGNAIKFTPQGSVTVMVQQMPRESDATQTVLAFQVKDTGQGILPEQARRLFNPFTQADASTTRKFGGTGLGLSLSRKIAKALGGDVRLTESVSGRGSTFTVTIDPGSSSDSALSTSDSSKPGAQKFSELGPALQGLKVLLVDDSIDNQHLVGRILSLAGAEVHFASDGHQAIEQVLSKKIPFDVILMDLQMPGMDGYSATRELRRAGFTLPIIALTAHAMTEERLKTLQSGFDNHVSKPIDQRELLRILSEIRSQSV